MRVDNGFKVWSYDGKMLYQETVEEIYQINWRPAAPNTFPNRPPSPRLYSGAKTEAPAAPTKPAKYVHPNAVGRTVASIKREEDGPTKYKKEHQVSKDTGPPGYVSPATTKNAKRNQKRKAKKTGEPQDSKEEEKEDVEKEETTQEVVPKQEEIVDKKPQAKSTEQDEVEIQKKIKVVQKKLRQIETLKEQQTEGKILDGAQLEKLQTEKSLKKELNDLQKLNK